MTQMAHGADLRELAKQGASKVLAECLRLDAGDVLALFWDETTTEPAELLLEVARDLRLDVRERRVPLEEQAAFAATRDISFEDRDAIESARGILTCVSSHVEGTAYRLELLKIGATAGKRFGHVPGANLSVLAHATNIDYENASSRCDDLALALTIGQMVRLQTYVLDEAGQPVASRPYDLEFEIGGLIRSPITSTGIIPLGTWGNLPGGETFISPMEDTAEGTFVLNGAFKNFVIKPPAYLLLHFEGGRLARVEGSAEERAAFDKILDYGRQRADPYYDALAELGIGVNTGIKELTGNALFDEKCYGTAHIAIGDGSRFGGRYSSAIHEDLVSRLPSLWVDNKPILLRGQDAFQPAEWRESLDDTLPNLQPLAQEFLVTRTAIKAERDNGRLRVRREVSSGRLCYYTVGDAETSEALARLYTGLLPRLPHEVLVSDLYRGAETLGLTPGQTTAALAILQRHGLVAVREPAAAARGDWRG
jgi:hypothetical protein